MPDNVVINRLKLDVLANSISAKSGEPIPMTLDQMTEAVDGIGGDGSAEPKDVNFLDYDGTIVYSYSKTDALALSALPSNPSHTGLTAQGWNWSLANIKSYLTKYPDATVNVGQMYITDDGKTRMYVHFEDGRCAPFLQLYLNGTVVIDWGDNSATDTLTGTALGSIKYIQHAYTQGGDYIITISVTGTARVQGNSNSGSGSYLLTKEAGTNSTYASQAYRNVVNKIEFGSGIELYDFALRNMQTLKIISIPKYMTSIGRNAFDHCYSLISVNLPNEITTINQYTFQNCSSLKSLTIPDGITSIENYALDACYSLKSLTIPDGVTSIGNYAFRYCPITSISLPDDAIMGNYAFYSCNSLVSANMPDNATNVVSYLFNYCYALARIVIPDGVTSIGGSAFQGCHSLASLTIPDGVTSILANAFASCYGMKEYHFLPTTPPTLANTNAFTNIQSDCIIYVPQESLEAYQTAANWSTYASYMQGE